MSDTHSLDYTLGVIAGMLFAMIFAVIVTAVHKKRNKQKPYYDERQQIARGKAYEIGFFTLMFYFIVYGFVDTLGVVWCENFVGIFIGILIAIAVFVVTAIRKDAYIRINENIKSFLILGAVIVVIEAVCTVMNFIDGTFLENGKLSTSSIAMFVGILWLVILIALLVHNRKLKKEEAVEE